MRDDLARVLVVGTTGSGKTTFARRLAAILGVPHIELDAIHWLAGWTPRDRDEFRALVEGATSPERWVMDGNYSAVRDIAWPRATALIWLNYPFLTTFWRVFWRTMARLVRRDELFGGNRENFRLTFLSKRSILWWAITTYARRRRQYRALFDGDAFPNLALIEFRRPGEAEKFLKSLTCWRKSLHQRRARGRGAALAVGDQAPDAEQMPAGGGADHRLGAGGARSGRLRPGGIRGADLPAL